MIAGRGPLARPERAALFAAIRLGLVVVLILVVLVWWVLQKQPDYQVQRRLRPELREASESSGPLSLGGVTRQGVQVQPETPVRWSVTVPGDEARLRLALAAEQGGVTATLAHVRGSVREPLLQETVTADAWTVHWVELPADPGETVALELSAAGGALVVADPVVESEGRPVDETEWPVHTRIVLSDLLAGHTLDLVRAPPTPESQRVNMPGPSCLPVRATQPRILEVEHVPALARLVVTVHLSLLSATGALPPTTLQLEAEGQALVRLPVDELLREVTDDRVSRELMLTLDLSRFAGGPLSIDATVQGGQNLLVGIREAYVTEPEEQLRRRLDPEYGVNVLLVLVDGLRADRLGVSGYAAGSTPHLDALAARGLRYTHVRAPSSWALPNVATLLTGTPPITHGLGLLPRRRLSGRVPTLARSATWAGYTTAWFGNGQLAVEHDDLVVGYESVDVRPLPASSLVEVFDDWLADAAQFEWLATVHLVDPLWPHDPSPEELATVGGVLDPALVERLRVLDSRPGAAEALAHELGPAYDAEVARVDRALGGLLDALQRHEVADRTLVIVLGTHGQEFFEHGGRGEGQTLHEEVVAVPLLLAGPPVPEGVVDEPLEFVDVTLLVGQLGRVLAGGNLPGRVPPPFGPAAPSPTAHSLLRPIPDVTRSALEASRRGPWLRVSDLESGQVTLFDLEHDPAASVDLLDGAVDGEAVEVSDGLAKAFDEWYEESVLTGSSRAETWTP